MEWLPQKAVGIGVGVAGGEDGGRHRQKWPMEGGYVARARRGQGLCSQSSLLVYFFLIKIFYCST